MAADLHVRPATLADLLPLAALFDGYRQFYGQSADIDGSMAFVDQRLRRHDAVILVAQARRPGAPPAGAMVGFCQLYPSFCSIVARPIQVLNDLFVTTDARGQGVGRALLLAAETQAAARGMARLELTTARSNCTAQSLYASLGWVRDEVYLAYSRTIPD